MSCRVPCSLCALLFALTLSSGVLGAQEPAPRIRTVATDIVLDGRLSEPEWLGTDSITDFRQKDPVEGAPATERTVVRLLATPRGLVVGWMLYDSDPSRLVRTQLRRDATLRSDDYVSLMVDGLSDQRSAFYFRTNVNGALWDGEHVNIETGNEEWDGVWDARTQVTAEGWSVEMRIPWATLRYPKDVHQMGMNFRRFLPRKNEEVLWRGWKRTQGFRFLEAEGTVVGFERLPPRARAELRPFVVTESALPERSFAADGTESLIGERSSDLALGLDVKLPVTSTLTADLTVFPDFAQAEVDRQIVNLTRFPLFFPEQRTFFTEGASIFAFGRPQQSQLFYSRRIGLGTAGKPVAIPVGARIQGRRGRTQIGFLAVRTGDDERASNLVARVRRDVLGRGYVGAMSTFSDRPDRPGAVGIGADIELPFVVRGRDNLILQGSAAWSRDSAGGGSGTDLRIVVDYPNDHADLVTRFDRIDEGYDPALGFVTQRGIYRWGGSFAITPRPARPSRIRRFEFNALNYDVVWGIDGTLDNGSFSVRPFGATFQSGDRVEVNLARRFDAPAEPFTLTGGATVAPGEYWWNRAELRYIGANVRRWALEATASAGAFYDGQRRDLSLVGVVRLQPHMELRTEVVRNDISLPTDDFAVTTLRVRADYAVSPRLTGTMFVQADNGSDRAAVNARLRWTTSPGSDFYLVWNSAWPTGLERGIPWDRPIRGGVVAKYVRFIRR